MYCDTMEPCRQVAGSGIGTNRRLVRDRGLVLEISGYLLKSDIFHESN